MKIDDIKNLNYNGFKKNRKKIEKCINNYFKKIEITYYEEIFEKINFILWGLNDMKILRNQNKYIGDTDAIFYVNKNESCFILKVTGTIEFRDDNSENFNDIKIKIKRKYHHLF